jgi:ADP-ribosylglycohydrolase
MNPWYTGRELIPSSIMASAIQPIGVINAGNPEQAYQDAMNIAAVHQDGSHRESAAAVAAGVARAFEPESTVHDVLDIMHSVAHDILTRSIDLTMSLVEEHDSIDSFAEAYYDEMLDWTWPAERWSLEKFEAGLLFSDNTLESVPIAMALLEFCEGDAEQSIVEGASFGRNCDAIASITGSIAGAVSGAEELPDSWITQCESANTPLFEKLGYDSSEGFKDMSQGLVKSIEQERQTARERLEFLDGLVENETA